MLGSRHPVGGGVQEADDGHVIIIPGEAASESAVFGVWGGDGVGVAVSPPTDSTQEDCGRETELGDHGLQQRATNLKYGFTNLGGAKEMPRRGVLGTSSNENSNGGSIYTTAFLGHRDYTGGGQPYPPTVPPVRYEGALEDADRATSHHHPVRQGVRKK